MNRAIVGVLLLIAGVLGLFMTACGGIFTVSSFGAGNSGIQGVLVLSVPSLIGGVLLLLFVKRKLQAWRIGAPAPAPPPPPLE
jgi:hypothetical protein